MRLTVENEKVQKQSDRSQYSHEISLVNKKILNKKCMAEPDVRPPGATNPSANKIYLVEIPLAVMTAGESRKATSTAQRRLARLAGAATNEAAPLTQHAID